MTFRFWLVVCLAVMATTTVDFSPLALAASSTEGRDEPGAEKAKESDGGDDGFDIGTVIDAIGSIGVPLGLAAAGFAGGIVTDRKLKKREYNKEQLGHADDFLAASGKVVRRLQSFADGRAAPDDVAPLREELYGVAEASTKITDQEIKDLGREFYERTVDVINAVGIKDRSTKTAGRAAVGAFDELRKGVERFRCELAPARKRATRRGTEYATAAAPSPQSPQKRKRPRDSGGRSEEIL